MIDKVGATPIQEPVLITGNPVTTKTQASDIAAVTIRGDTTVTKPDPAVDISPDNVATITGISSPTITATAGAASNSQTVSGDLYSLPDGVADEYDGQAGQLIKRIKKLVLDGTESWIKYPSQHNRPAGVNAFSCPGLTPDGTQSCPACCTHAQWLDGAWESAGNWYWGISMHETYLAPIINCPYATVDEWKAFLVAQAAAGTPVTIYYPLDRPVITEARHDLACYDGITTLAASGVPAENLAVTLLDGRIVGKARDADYLAGLHPSAYLFGTQNLLINWDFRQPVNQRGQSSYTTTSGSIPCLDRWLINAGVNLEIKDGYVTCTSTGQYQYFYSSLLGVTGDVTLSIAFRAMGKVMLAIYDMARTGAIGYLAATGTGSWQILSVSVTVPESHTGISVIFYPGYATAGGSADILAAELVPGGVSLLPYRLRMLPDYGAELAKCQRYLAVIRKNNPHRAQGITKNDLRFCVPIPVSMVDGTPTIVNPTALKVFSWDGVEQTGFTLSCWYQRGNGEVVINAAKTAHGLSDAYLKSDAGDAFITMEI